MARKKETNPDTRQVVFGKDVYLRDDGTVVHVGRAHDHPEIITAGTPVDLTEAEIKAIEEALAPPEELAGESEENA